MTDKELLEEAKEWRNDLLLTLVTTDLSDDLKKYTRKYKEILSGLIEQAERVQELEKQNKRYRKYLELIRITGTHGRIISTGEIIRSDEANLAEEALEGEE